MSRGQETQTFNTATGNSATDQSNAESAFGATNNAIGNYEKNLQQFVSGNPFTAGGEYATDINQGLTNVSDAGSNSLKGALQSQALRTGQNSAADAATASSAAQQNTRNLSGQLASADQQRINSEAQYNQAGLQASAVPISANQALYGTSVGAANSALGTAQQAAQAPSFWDEVGNGVAGGLSKALGGTSATFGPVKICWIAAELYGGWDDPRTFLVRVWLNSEFREHVIGRHLVALYARFGERTAVLIRKYPVLKILFRPMFDAALAKARKHEAFCADLTKRCEHLINESVTKAIRAKYGFVRPDVHLAVMASLYKKFTSNRELLLPVCVGPICEDTAVKRLTAVRWILRKHLPAALAEQRYSPLPPRKEAA